MAAREVARTHRMRCRECGSAFTTPNRSVKYCSDMCREESRANRHRRRPGRRPQRPDSDRGKGAKKCGACGKSFVPTWGPGGLRAYCSDACRTEGGMAKNRECLRRYLADPRRRAIETARVNALRARRRAEKGG